MSVCWQRHDFEYDRRREAETEWPPVYKAVCWILAAIVSAGLWSLIWNLGTWLAHFWR